MDWGWRMLALGKTNLICDIIIHSFYKAVSVFESENDHDAVSDKISLRNTEPLVWGERGAACEARERACSERHVPGLLP